MPFRLQFTINLTAQFVTKNPRLKLQRNGLFAVSYLARLSIFILVLSIDRLEEGQNLRIPIDPKRNATGASFRNNFRFSPCGFKGQSFLVDYFFVDRKRLMRKANHSNWDSIDVGCKWSLSIVALRLSSTQFQSFNLAV